MQFGVKSIKVFDEATIDENKKDAVIFLNLLKYLGLTVNGELTKKKLKPSFHVAAVPLQIQ